MQRFELKLNNVLYVCDSTHQSKEHQNWNVRAEINGLKVCIDIPIEEQANRSKVILFVTAFHEAMAQAVKDLKVKELQYGKHNIG